MRHLLTGLSAIVLLAYPFAIYFGIDKFGLGILGAVLAVFFVLRIFTASRTKLKEFKQLAIISGLIGITLIVLGILFRSKGWLLFYPVAVNACMLMVFASSLKQPQTIIERLARLQEPDLPQSGVDYTRKVTQIWCLFFLFNGITALYTCFLPIEIWTLYNGLISYLLIGALFAVEWVVRQFVRKD
ncbi:hypothetical protein HUO09_02780 [Vibrio sp. Y2-5]|uniref:COG4648 family protein n=1 Tax=Vibrio TaxID=662 RepID=UPI00142DBBBA|nr:MULTISPECIES: hypothetical protein [Vibrio]MBD0785247.1 hypothetical protein [Vibrio sp. Y2-5]NIY91006.1 DNA gyrase subunit B [Vibrio diazotrophicus]